MELENSAVDLVENSGNATPGDFDPVRLLDALIELLCLSNDRQLSDALGVAAPMISKIRCRRMQIGASLLIRMHEASGLPVGELRTMMGDRRKTFRMSDKRNHQTLPAAN